MATATGAGGPAWCASGLGSWRLRGKKDGRYLYTIQHSAIDMAETVSVRLDEAMLRDLEELAKELKTDRSEALRRVLAEGLKQTKMRRIVELLREEKISIGKAAELAGISRYEVLDLAEREGVPYGYSLEDLERDLADPA